MIMEFRSRGGVGNILCGALHALDRFIGAPEGPWGSPFGQQLATGLDYLEEFVIRPIQAIQPLLGWIS